MRVKSKKVLRIFMVGGNCLDIMNPRIDTKDLKEKMLRSGIIEIVTDDGMFVIRSENIESFCLYE